jgi:hypothetical protein
VAIALDGDDAGDAGSEHLTPVLQSVGARVERWRPVAKDWNEALLMHGADALHTALLGQLARPCSLPGPPHFDQTGPNTWIETAWSRERCVFCPELLAQSDTIACDGHRRQLDATSGSWSRLEGS